MTGTSDQLRSENSDNAIARVGRLMVGIGVSLPTVAVIGIMSSWWRVRPVPIFGVAVSMIVLGAVLGSVGTDTDGEVC